VQLPHAFGREWTIGQDRQRSTITRRDYSRGLFDHPCGVDVATDAELLQAPPPLRECCSNEGADIDPPSQTLRPGFSDSLRAGRATIVAAALTTAYPEIILSDIIRRGQRGKGDRVYGSIGGGDARVEHATRMPRYSRAVLPPPSLIRSWSRARRRQTKGRRGDIVNPLSVSLDDDPESRHLRRIDASRWNDAACPLQPARVRVSAAFVSRHVT